MDGAAVISPWALEILIALTILMLLNVVAMHFFQYAVFKARAVESLASIGGQKVALIEHFAQTGEWLDSDVGVLGDVAGAGEDAAGGLLRGTSPVKTETGSKDRDRKDSFQKTTVSGIRIVVPLAQR